MVESAILACCVVLAADSTDVERPNLVMILADDQGFGDFGFMGNALVKTPNIDRLASQSARYVNAYVPSSVCRPSLATLLTGLYPHEHGVWFNHPPPGNAKLSRMSADDYYSARARAEEAIQRLPSLPRILAKSGYDCLQTGKFWEGHWRNAGFTEGMTTGRAAGVPGCWDKKLPDGITVAHGNGDAGLVIGRTTMRPLWEFIDRHDEAGDRPFFIWYAPVMPHEPHNPPEEYLRRYRDDPKVPERFAAYYAMCSWFDATVGQLIDRLEQKGLAHNTIFVFVSDNGWAPDMKKSARTSAFGVDERSKRSPFEAGLRTPILIRWDGHIRPATHEAPASSVDIVPSILHAMGMGEAAADMSGVDLMPSATGKQPLASRPVFGEIYPGDATRLGDASADIAYRWVRDGRLKLIVPQRHDGQKPWRSYLTEPALFDVVADPGESVNLIDDPQYADEVTRLSKLLDAWWLPGGDSSEAK